MTLNALRKDRLTSLCDEVILQILYCLNGVTILRLSQTCRRLYRICSFDQQLWSRLCLVEFTINLSSPDPFISFRHLYKLIYQSREILRLYLSANYPNSENHRYGVLPSWLWTWIVLNTSPPLLPSWIRNYHEPFLRFKLSEISLGKVLRVWNLKSIDLPGHLVARVEYGTSYYRWRDIQIAALRVHGGPKGLERFLLKRCARARGYVERAHERLRSRNLVADSWTTVTTATTSRNELPSSSSSSSSGLGSDDEVYVLANDYASD